MANPIPIRPWSRLASLRNPPPPPPESHPKPHTAEPSLKATNTFSNDNKGTSATKSLPTSSNVHRPMHSQKLKFITPMTFPPAKLKVHPHPGVEVTIEKPNGNGNASMKTESGDTQKQLGTGPNEKKVTNKENEMKEKGTQTKLPGSEANGIRVITISGENRGAHMQITQPHKKPIHKMGNSDGEKKVRTLSSPPMRAVYGNSNVQRVNNSMLFHTSLTHHDPGMHLIIPKKPLERVGGQRN